MDVGGGDPGGLPVADRNAAQKVLAFTAFSRAPFGQTTEITYTVPAGRKCQITNVFTQICRATAATPPGFMACWCQITPNGGAMSQVAYTIIATNVAGNIFPGPCIVLHTLLAGDKMEIVDIDTSTGGTAHWAESIVGVEYAA